MRRQIYIGDVQGCWKPFGKLLDKLRFDPSADQLCMAGDLVNRGGKSLRVLREMVKLGKPHFTVLGNHDLHLLAYTHRWPKVGKRNAEFDRILEHPEADAIISWLKRQPLLSLDKDHRIALVHAGIDPRWDRAQARKCAAEVEHALQGGRFGKFIDHMYGDKPAQWKAEQKRFTRLRTITNVLTRMRFAQPDGTLELRSSGNLKKPPKGYRPWFELMHPAWRKWSVVFGHWSLLGHHRYKKDRAICLDSGCVWGGCLTALVVEDDERRIVQYDC